MRRRASLAARAHLTPTGRRLAQARRSAAIALLIATPLAAAGVSVAHACGAFRARTVSPEQRPSLAREKVLLLYDAEQQRQHFIREIAFARTGDPFGFVVPTPSKPEIASLEEPSLFTVLRDSFPFSLRLAAGRGRSGGRSDSGYGRGSGGVRVVEETRIGSFRAFVLEATDPHALEAWLDTNDFVTTPASTAWLEHYVAMKFFYVAMRYDPPKSRPAEKDAGADPPPAVAAETIRISFDTPLPYYPYLEPAEPRTGLDPRRLLELWVVGPAPVVPVATQRSADGSPTWVRPLREGNADTTKRGALQHILPDVVAPFVPDGDLVVQTFQDQKTTREGFGDVLFVPQVRRELSDQRVAALQRLLPLVDPAIEPAIEPASEVAP